MEEEVTDSTVAAAAVTVSTPAVMARRVWVIGMDSFVLDDDAAAAAAAGGDGALVGGPPMAEVLFGRAGHLRFG